MKKNHEGLNNSKRQVKMYVPIMKSDRSEIEAYLRGNSTTYDNAVGSGKEIRQIMSQMLEEILSNKNIKLARDRVYQNKGASGIDGVTVKELDQYMEDNWDSIKQAIRERRYKPQPVRRVEIPKPNGGVRNLGIPTVIDRVIEQAIAQVLSPIFEPLFSEYSYGFRPNRCCEQAIIKLLEYLNDEYIWIVDIDLEKFFDNVPQDKLMSYIGRVIHDGDVESLIRKYLKAGVMVRGHYEPTEKGTPQGGNISPLLSNNWSVDLSYRIEKLNQVIRGWINYFIIGRMKKNLTNIDKHLRTMIRVIIWKQRKVPSKREWGLKKLGINKDLARLTAYCGDRYQWVVTKTCVVRAISKEKLRQKGLVSCLDYYNSRRHNLGLS